MAEIYVYDSKCDDFTNFGLVGALTPTSCVFEEEANGMSEITLVHPLDNFGRYTALVTNNLLIAEVPVRTTPEIDGGKIVTSIEQWKVQSASKSNRTLYKKNKGNAKIKVLPVGTVVTVVKKPDEGRYKVKTQYGSGWFYKNGLESAPFFVTTIEDKSQSIESVEPAWTVKPQIFRIYNVEKTINSVKVSARHISYDLLYNLITYKTADEVSCGDALNAIMDKCISNHDFEAYTNLNNMHAGIDWTRINPISALLDPENGLVKLYNAALVRDDWELYVLHDPGMNRGVTVEYGKNMTGITYAENYDGIVTRIVPVGETKNGDPLLLGGDKPWIDSDRINDYPVVYAQELVCENCKVGSGGVDSTATARARMAEQAKAVFENGGDLPRVELSVDFINIGDTEEYRQFKNLERLFLWDYVIVRHKLQSIDVTARVVYIRWDCMRQRMESMEIGSVGKTLANTGINTWQIPTGFSGSKIAGDTIGSAALQSDIIATRHLQSDSVNTSALQAEAVTAEKIAAGAITAEKIKAGAIDAATLNAVIAKIEQLDASNILTDTFGAALAKIAVLSAGTAEFDRATVEHLVANLFNLTGSAVMEDVFIHNLRIAYAQMVSASIGNLVLRAESGEYYRIDVDQNGNVTATAIEEPSEEEKTEGITNGRPIIETAMTVEEMNASTVKAVHMLINKIDAARIDTDELFANNAFIAHLQTTDISSNSYIQQSIINTATGEVERYVRQDGSGVIVGKQGSAEQLVLDEGGVATRINGRQFSKFASNFVEFGEYQLRRTADGGMAFKLREG